MADEQSTQLQPKQLENKTVNGLGQLVLRCQKIKHDGNQCKGTATKSSNGAQLCSIHNGFKPWDAHKIDIKNGLDDILVEQSNTLRDLKTGKITPQQANARVNLFNSARQTHETVEVQRYLSSNINNNVLDSIKDSIPADYDIPDD